MGRPACCPAWASVHPKAPLPVRLPTDASPWGTGAWDAWAGARPAATAADWRSAHRVADAGKLAVPARAVPAPDAWWLPQGRQVCSEARPAAEAPYTPDAAPSEERSSAAAALSLVVERSELPVWPPCLAPTVRAPWFEVAEPPLALRKQPRGGAALTAEPVGAAPRESPGLRLEEELAAQAP